MLNKGATDKEVQELHQEKKTLSKQQKEEKAALRLQKELKRLNEMRFYENQYSETCLIAGIDEVGRGPLAGPVITAAVILPRDCEILYLNDSKKLTEKRREDLFLEISEKAIAIGIGSCTHLEIDELNILQATYKAMREAISKLSPAPDLLLNDAVTIPGVTIRQVPIIKGDAKSVSIAAASVIAKVTRDHLMIEYDKIYPEYDFASNKGYGSKTHIDALRRIGPCPLHRRSFIKNFVGV